MKRLSFSLLFVFFGFLICNTGISAQDIKPLTGSVLNGKAIKLVKPDYPPAAQAVDARGVVNVQVMIDEKGEVILSVAVSGHPLLRRSAEKAARLSKFAPTFLEGKPVKVTGIILYNFTPRDNMMAVVQTEEIEEEALNGFAVRLPSPEYPPAARAVGASGKVKVEVSLDENGNVVSANAVSGHPLLRESAAKAAREAKFDPAAISKKSPKTEGTLIYVFFTLPKEK